MDVGPTILERVGFNDWSLTNARPRMNIGEVGARVQISEQAPKINRLLRKIVFYGNTTYKLANLKGTDWQLIEVSLRSRANTHKKVNELEHKPQEKFSTCPQDVLGISVLLTMPLNTSQYQRRSETGRSD